MDLFLVQEVRNQEHLGVNPLHQMVNLELEHHQVHQMGNPENLESGHTHQVSRDIQEIQRYPQ